MGTGAAERKAGAYPYRCSARTRFGVCSMPTHPKQPTTSCPVTTELLVAEARQRFDKLLSFCLHNDHSFWKFEKCLLALLALLGRLLVRLFLTARHERLDVQPHLQDGAYRLSKVYAERTVKTAWGEVHYGRSRLSKRKGGSGFYPLDVALGLTRDRLSPWMMH